MDTIKLEHSFRIEIRQPNAPFEFAKNWQTFRREDSCLADMVESLRHYRAGAHEGEEFRLIQVIRQEIVLTA